MKLYNVCDYVTERIDSQSLTTYNYISTENMLPNKEGITYANNIPKGNVIAYNKGDILISNIRPYFKKIWQANINGGCSSDVLCIRAKSTVSSKFLFYLLSQQSFFDYVMSGSKGCKMPRGDKQQIMQWDIELPTLEEQTAIANILSSLDDKIELNRRINENLEQQAQALFDFYFIQHPEKLGSYERGSLIDIANYTNGLAMQKFRPQIEEKGIPVLKIKELGQGRTDSSSDVCSENISREYIVNDGDVIFSWSGTLMVNIWCGGLCGLNQHLFKVTSDKYPKWFYYFWTKYHLGKFIRIAKDKAVTMGHIKRGDLETSEVLIPEIETLSKLDEIISPILNQIIAIKCENKNLENLRDTLLPKLMYGELQI